jgi:hypothetical protein
VLSIRQASIRSRASARERNQLALRLSTRMRALNAFMKALSVDTYTCGTVIQEGAVLEVGDGGAARRRRVDQRWRASGGRPRVDRQRQDYPWTWKGST